MGQNLHILRDWIGAGTTDAPVVITANSGNANAPNLATIQPSQGWASTITITSGAITIDLGVARTFDGVWLGAASFGPNATMRIRCADTSGALTAATGADDSGTISVWRASGRMSADDYPLDTGDQRWEGTDHYYRFAVARTRRWVLINIVDTGNVNDRTGFGILRIGQVLQPARNFAWGWSFALNSGAVRQRNAGGGMNIADGAHWRTLRLRLGWLKQQPPTVQDAQKLYETLKWVAHARDLVVVCDPDADHDWHLKALCGVPTNAVEFLNNFVRHWQSELVVEQLI